MPRSQQVRAGFMSGVLSPRMTLRADTAMYDEALQEGVNALISPQGGWVMREGFEFLADTTESRLFQFHRGGDIDDLLIQVTATQILVYDDPTAAPRWTFTNHLYFNDTGEAPQATLQQFLRGLYFVNTEEMGALLHPDYPPYLIYREQITLLSQIADTGEYLGEHLTHLEVPRVLLYDAPSYWGINGQAIYTITFPDATRWPDGGKYRVIYGDDVATTGLGPAPGPLTLTWVGDPENNDIQPPDTGEPNFEIDENARNIRGALKGTSFLLSQQTDVVVERSTTDPRQFTVIITGPGAGYEITIDPLSGQLGVPEVTGGGLPLEPAWTYPFTITHNGTFYRCIQLHRERDSVNKPTEPGVGADWQEYWEEVPSGELVSVTVQRPNGQQFESDPESYVAVMPFYYAYQHQFTRRSGNPAWDWEDPQTWNAWDILAIQAPWNRRFPQVGSFFQQRLILMATDSLPTSLWGSRIGDFRSYEPGVNDADPFFFDIATNDSPKIKWAEVTQSAMIVGTSAGDFRVGGEITLGPSDISVVKQDSARSHKARAVSDRNTAFYIEQGRRKMRATRYGRDQDAWTSVEISLPAEHLFYPQAERLAILRAPELQVLALLDDGNMVVASAAETRDGLAFAFTQYQTANNHRLVDIAAIYSVEDGQDRLYAIVQHADGVFRLERMPYPNREVQARVRQEDPTLLEQGIVLLDSWLPVELVDTNRIDGLWHRGTVSVIIDDAWIGKFEVDDTGVIDLGRQYSGTAVVGYSYEATGKTFENVRGNPRGVGFGAKHRWNRLYIRLLNSALPIINGQRPDDRTPAHEMGVAETVRQGLQDVRINDLGHDDGSVEIRQDRPYPTHVLGYYGEITVNNA